ncbi:MAG: ThuA domain-containing protein [Sphingobium sp.]
MSKFGRPQVELIVGGENHDTNRVRAALLDLLGENELLRVRCSPDFGDGAALAETDFLITYTNNVFPEGDALPALDRFLDRGGRWLAIHGASAFTCFKPPAVNIGGIHLPGLTDTPDSKPDYMNLLGVRFVSHLAPQPYTVTLGPVPHAVTEGIEPFEVIDEPYILELRGKGEVLLEARYTGEAPGYVEGPWLVDDARPQLIRHRHGAGEVMYLAPGHSCGKYDLRPFIDEISVQSGPWASDAYVALVRRLLAWGVAPVLEPVPVV